MAGIKPIRQRYVDQIKLDANGTGSIEFTMKADFLLTQTIWRVTPPASVTTPKQTNAVSTINGEDWEGTYSGNQDQSGSMHLLITSDVFRCTWTGGDPNGVAQLTLRGIEYPAGTGMNLYQAGGAGGPPVAGSAGPGNPILGGNTLIRDAIQSRNFVAGVSGWQVAATGHAEFSDATIRGSLSADNGNVLVNDTGVSITGSGQKVTIVDSGLFVQEVPFNGAYVQLAGAAGFGGVIFLQPENSSVAGTLFVPAEIYVSKDETVTDSRPFLKLFSPAIDSSPDLHTSQIVLHGQAKLSGSDDSYVEIVGSALQVNGELNYGSAGSIPKDQIGSTTNGNTNAGTFQNTLNVTGTHGTVFVAPPSGSVYVIVTCVAGNDTAGSYSVMDWEIRAGSTIGSGTVWRGANENTAAVHQSGTANNQGDLCSFGIATGLTPGDTYNAFLCYHAASGGTSSYNRRHIAVIPMPNA